MSVFENVCFCSCFLFLFLICIKDEPIIYFSSVVCETNFIKISLSAEAILFIKDHKHLLSPCVPS